MKERQTTVLEALIVSSDSQVLEILGKTFVRLEISASTCDEVAAPELLEKYRFDVIVVDGKHDTATAKMLDQIRWSRSSRTSTVLALARSGSQVTELLKLGASLVITKPITYQLAWKTLQATLGVIEQERRSYFRHKLDADVNVSISDGKECVAKATNLSEGGMALKFCPSSPCVLHAGPGTFASIRFQLPSGMSDWVSAKASIAWVDFEGRAGLRFEIVDPDSKATMDSWRKANFTSDL